MRIITQSDEKLKEYHKFELGLFPLSLFYNEGMRKCVKSSIYKAFSSFTDYINLGNIIHVIDGGYLLHRFVWHRNESFSSICANYVHYVQTHYGSNAIVVFDAYPTDAANKNTKSAERLGRSRTHTCADVHFEESMVSTVTQEKLLSNETNKNPIDINVEEEVRGIQFYHEPSSKDADTLIVNTVITHHHQ
jgi:hypothetical protein